MIRGAVLNRSRPIWSFVKCGAHRSTIMGSDDDGDFFGIKHFTADDIKGINALNPEQKKRLDEKHSSYHNLKGLKVKNENLVHITTFGSVRYDSENVIETEEQIMQDDDFVKIEKGRRYLLDLALAKEIASETDQEGNKDCQKKEEKEEKAEEKGETNFVDDQYFGKLKENKESEEIGGKKLIDESELNYIDYQYFKVNYAPEMSPEGFPIGPIKFKFTPEWEEFRQELDLYDIVEPKRYRKTIGMNLDNLKNLDNIILAGDSPLRSVDEVSHELSILAQSQKVKEEEEEEDDENQSIENEEETDDIEKGCVKPDTPKTAFDYVIQLRKGQLEPEDKSYLAHLQKKYQEMGKEFKFQKTYSDGFRVDSQGKRNYKDQIPNLNLMRRDELIWSLKKRVLFNDRDVIAIDKPYGLIVEGAEGNKKYPSLESLLPELSKAIFGEEGQLFIVHRLDRDATGVLLLARTLNMVSTLRDMFAKRKISKYYWAITKGTPDPPVGIIDIPIEQTSFNGFERMVLRPECDDDFNRKMNRTRGARPATTHYRLLRKSGNACLVEVNPEQGIKHQIRVHLGFGLRTPILGDHKYSHLEKLAPQKLPDDMLEKLQVRQSKVRNIPLHLHAKMYIIPEIGAGAGTVTIPAHLPGFFKANMSSLGLYKKDSVIKSPVAF